MEPNSKSDHLRKRAQELLEKKGSLNTQDFAQNLEELVESLQVYQIELEIQNEELMRLQQSLEKSRSRFEKLFNLAPVAYCILSLEGKIVETNAAFKELLDLAGVDSKGKLLSQLVDEKSQDDFYLHFKQTHSNPNGFSSTIAFKSKKGLVYVKLHSQLEQLFDEEEQVVLCTLNNITNEINYHKELSLSEERFRSLVTSLDDVVFTLDTEQRHTGVFGRWLERFNQTPADYLGKTSAQILGKENAAIHEKHNIKALKGENVVYEWSTDYPGGRSYFQTSLSPIYSSGNDVIGIAGVARDITELKKAQLALTERHKELNCLYTITSLGNDTNLMVNDYLKECINLIPSGFTQPDNTVVRIAIGDEVYQSNNFIETQYSLSSSIKINDAIVGKIDVYCLNQKCLDTDEHFGEEEKSLLTAIADHLSYIIKRNRDGDEISQQYVSLQRLNAEKDKLFSIIGHDLRSPLSTILGLASVLESKFDTLPADRLLTMLNGISQTANNIYQLLENLLEWARFQRGTMDFNQQGHNLFSLVESIQGFFKQQLDAKQIVAKTSVPKDIVVNVDKNMFQSTLRNLVSNAIKFTNKQGEINITAKQANNGFVEIAVADNGIGMDYQIQENLFKIECNVGREGTDNEPSSGLGLLLCKEFIEKHEGKIWVESQEGKGSTFYFTLPLA